jgi:hypothetical protein
MAALSPTHTSYLEKIGIAERPLTSSIIATRQRGKRRSPGRAAQVVGIFSEDDLGRLRGHIFWRFHTDEVRDGRSVLVKRGLATVARVECATETLAWDAERICAGIRFKRGDQ